MRFYFISIRTRYVQGAILRVSCTERSQAKPDGRQLSYALRWEHRRQTDTDNNSSGAQSAQLAAKCCTNVLPGIVLLAVASMYAAWCG